ncbi:MAG: hypothetical protein IKE41_00010, partial [Clostridia bacterium]|nr:hypothetical protein [Clostridia bacterium]MBR2735270.1 hypothetical protein [Clostridia bacterium]
MNISRKCVEIWDKFKRTCGVYIRALLIIAGVAGALFAGHEFDVNADEGTYPTVHYDVNIYITGRTNTMPLWGDQYNGLFETFYEYTFDWGGTPVKKGYTRNVERSETENLFETAEDAESVYRGNITQACLRFNSSSGLAADVARLVRDGPEDYHVEFDPFGESVNLDIDYTTATLSKTLYVVLWKTPNVTIKDTSGNDIKDKFETIENWGQYIIGGDQTLDSPVTPCYEVNTLNIKPKDGSSVPFVKKNNLTLRESGVRKTNGGYVSYNEPRSFEMDD